MSSPRFVHVIGWAIAFGGAAWVLKFSLSAGVGANAQLDLICGALWLAGFTLPIAIARALTIYTTGRASHVAQMSVFVLFSVTMLLLVGLTIVSGGAFARAMLRNAPPHLTAELPVLVLGLTGLALAPLFWLGQNAISRE